MAAFSTKFWKQLPNLQKFPHHFSIQYKTADKHDIHGESEVGSLAMLAMRPMDPWLWSPQHPPLPADGPRPRLGGMGRNQIQVQDVARCVFF